MATAGVSDTPTAVVADAGYWHLEQMNEITGQGIPVLIPPDSSRRSDKRPGCNGGAYDFMRAVLSTERGSELYEQRGQLIGPIFGPPPNITAALAASTDAEEPPRGPSGD